MIIKQIISWSPSFLLRQSVLNNFGATLTLNGNLILLTGHLYNFVIMEKLSESSMTLIIFFFWMATQNYIKILILNLYLVTCPLPINNGHCTG